MSVVPALAVPVVPAPAGSPKPPARRAWTATTAPTATATRWARWVPPLLKLLVYFVRLASAVTLLLLAGIHLYLGSTFGQYAERTLEVWRPGLVATVFLMLAAANLYPLARGVWRRACPRRYGRGVRLPPSLRRRPSALDRTVRRVDELFGIRGRFFTELIVTTELVEVTTQTFNLFDIAASGVKASGVFSFALVLAANAVVSPALLLANSVVVYRDANVIADSLFDFAYSVVWPMVQIGDMLWDALHCNGVVADQHLVINALSVTQQLLVEGAGELVVKVTPFLSSHVLLMELWAVIVREEGPVAPAPAPARRRCPPWLRWLVTLLGVSFAATLLAVVGSHVGDRCSVEPLCAKQAYPLTSTHCECLIVEAGCAEGAEPLAAADTAVLADAAARFQGSLRALNVDHCGLDALPAPFADMPRLWFLVAGHNRLRDADLERLGSLFTAEFDYNRFQHLPRGPAGRGVLAASFAHNNISAIRDDVDDLANVVSLNLAGNRIREVPCALGALPIVRLYLSSNNISAWGADGCFDAWTDSLEFVLLAGNNITRLPADFARMRALADASLAGNPLCERPPEERGVRAPSSGDVCAPVCAPDCAAFLTEDNFCNYQCDTEACERDGGACVADEC